MVPLDVEPIWATAARAQKAPWRTTPLTTACGSAIVARGAAGRPPGPREDPRGDAMALGSGSGVGVVDGEAVDVLAE